ncbi:SPRY-domain-containing protein [Calocera cornea HHB12733]|uniref:SPRY-domain-containing protein n=1 Tax=Calocera cornea HHB12733 TaxID=1353952 RepID=A0A165GVF6_9BASI|nr:SPRY-domain-containing protein [Calocera cornea HHB12733]
MSAPPADADPTSPTLAELSDLLHASASVLQRLSAPASSPTTPTATAPAPTPSSTHPLPSHSHPPLLAPGLGSTGALRIRTGTGMDRGRSATVDHNHNHNHLPPSTPPGTGAAPASIFPSLLTSLAHHRLPRPAPPTSNPRIVRSASHSSPSPSGGAGGPAATGAGAGARASQSPTRRRQSVHASPLPHAYPGQAHSPLAPYLRPRGPSYLSTLPSPGFPLPSYLSHSAWAAILRTGQAEGPRPVDYAFPLAAARNGEARPELPVGGVRMRRSTARHSDSDTSPTPTHRRARSAANAGGATPEREAKDTVSSKADKPAHDPLAPLYIPTKWHATLHSPFLTLTPDALGLTYTSAGGNGDRDAATALASHPIPPHTGVYYYEVEVLDKGLNGYISIGVCKADMPLGRLPGWEDGSWGYHGDDGHAFTGTQTDTDYGPKFTSGDVVGCGVDYTTGTAFYTKNGLLIGNPLDTPKPRHRAHALPGPVFSHLPAFGPLYPCVGLRSPNESVRANFGQTDFRFDIDGYVRRRADAVLREAARWSLRAGPLSSTAPVKVEDGDDAAATRGPRVVVRFTGGPHAEEDALLRRRARRPTIGAAASEKTPKKTPKRESITSRAAVDSSAAEDAFKKGHKASGSLSVSLTGKKPPAPERGDEEDLRLALDALVLDYMAYCGFGGAAEALARESAARAGEAGAAAAEGAAGPPWRAAGVQRPESAMDVDLPAAAPAGVGSGSATPQGFWKLPMQSIRARQEISTHILAGEIDPALDLLALHWPGLLRTRAPRQGAQDESAIEEDQDDAAAHEDGEGEAGEEMYSELSCRLECRKFVELVLACASPSAPRSPISPALASPATVTFPPAAAPLAPGQNPPASPPATPSLPAPTPPTQELSEAFAYGRILHHRYLDSGTLEMRALVSKTFSLLGFARPEEATGEVGQLVGPGAREELAQWVNEVILRAEGHNERPALARAWAQTKSTMAQLAALNVGRAAFMDVDEEFGAGRRGDVGVGTV